MAVREIVDIYDANGGVIATMSRTEAEKDSHTTTNVLIFVFNKKGNVWVQLRPKTKSHFPGMWDISACGGVLSGEPHEKAAHRETKEEMGFTTKLLHVESFMNIFPGHDGKTAQRLSHLYIGTSDETPKINVEVDEFKSWKPKKLRQHVLDNPDLYVPSFIFELDKATKAHGKLAGKNGN